jgi:acetyl-CoA carboxylase biotin carboxyl carrier protein
MNIDEIRQLVQLMVDNDLDELDITEGENKIKLRRNASGQVVAVAPAAAVPAVAAAAPAAAPAEAPPAEEELLDIKSPMVGTFYAASSPDADAYVTVGSKVGEDTVVCIVEAMKVMNEVKAECAGEIVELRVKNAEPVEYGQVLFRVRPF